MLCPMDQAVLDRLVENATDKNPASRRALLADIVGLCDAPVKRLSETEKHLAGEILVRVVREFEVQMRAEVAEKLAASANVPKQLIRALAEDEIVIAKPVILTSPLLDETDLLSIIDSKSREHRLLVAERPHISSAVGDALIKAGEPEVLLALLNNQTAAISHAAMEYAVEESRSRAILRGPLVTRADLPLDLAKRMISFVSIILKREIAAKFPNDADITNWALLEIADAQAEKQRELTQNSQNISAKAAALINKLQINGELNLTRVISFLRERRMPLFFAGLAALTKMNERNLMELAFDGAQQGLAAICREANADRGQFVSIALLLEQARTGQSFPAQRLQIICRQFDGLSVEKAETIVANARSKSPGLQRQVNVA
ncbi:MAG TPA: hypothetical protein DCO82_02340 [Alphaproteobacteria bacterium]|nr:hypothetical protein [Alphaproteobacteria bacterium]